MQKKHQKNNRDGKHEFALHVEGLSQLLVARASGSPFSVSDASLFHRLAHVLRLAVDQTCIFFDQSIHARVELKQFRGKKQIETVVISVQEHKPLTPAIRFFLPLLKRDQFEKALYALAQLGVDEIQPVITEKIARKWGGQREYDRSRVVMISAAEQAKQFTIPQLQKPVQLDALCVAQNYNDCSAVFFDPAGQNAAQLFCTKTKQFKKLVLMVGPEGDLSGQEKELIKSCGFIFCALTPTILRASDAVVVAVGLVRSLVRP